MPRESNGYDGPQRAYCDYDENLHLDSPLFAIPKCSLFAGLSFADARHRVFTFGEKRFGSNMLGGLLQTAQVGSLIFSP
jgi:hypothetical protein